MYYVVPFECPGFGIRKSIGHVDFWPNGGQHQPGCPEETWGILVMLNFEADFTRGACSHSRAVSLFIDSIELCRYDPDGKCTMGYHTSPKCRGDYYPDTLSEEPFC
ncbi:pancreatic triacylglycerol lipase [Elysia marginata]|uniref:Pancreatic triacylglycerol lipase n=1 Tax=Elysia marginata TaxID=1093978 RepID=A0AAV4FBW1_9GAST|nr:pancreatic triacylglycerol lipase [Elysia marginata]